MCFVSRFHFVGQKQELKAGEEGVAEREVRERKRKEEVEAVLSRIRTAADEFDAKELKNAFAVADELGVPQDEYAEAYELFINLHNSSFVRAKHAQLRDEEDDEYAADDLLLACNLVEQLDTLGVRPDDMRDVSADLTHMFASGNQAQSKAARKCFEDPSNFSKLRDPEHWGQTALLLGPVRSRSECVNIMLRYSAERIPEALTKISPEFEQASLRNFGNILRAMGDKPSAYIGNKENAVIRAATQSLALTDETFLQIMKQLRGNPSIESTTKGWKLLTNLLGEASPSDELCQYLRAFIEMTLEDEDDYLDDNEDDLHSMGSTIWRGSSRQTCVSPASIVQERSPDRGSLYASFLEERPRMAEDALKALLELMMRNSREAHEYQDMKRRVRRETRMAGISVSVQMDDSKCERLKMNAFNTVDDLHARIVEKHSLRDGTNFDLFISSGNQGININQPLRLVPRLAQLCVLVDELETNEASLVFAHMNVRYTQEFPVDDLVGAQLFFLQATRQYLAYDMPHRERDEKTFAEISAALVIADQATYKKTKRGQGTDKQLNEKAVSIIADIKGGLLGEGVLERYVPKAQLPRKERAEWANRIMGLVKSNPFTGLHPLLTQSRAVSLMQSRLPHFEAYKWTAVQVPALDISWDGTGTWLDLECSISSFPPQRPQQELQLGEQRECTYKLLVDRTGLVLLPQDPNLSKLEIMFVARAGQWTITGWQPTSISTLALSCKRVKSGTSAEELSYFALKVLNDTAPAVACLLVRFTTQMHG